jgi:hypothetical protein
MATGSSKASPSISDMVAAGLSSLAHIGKRAAIAALAQLVEHIIRNDGVTCSSHVSGTSFPKNCDDRLGYRARAGLLLSGAVKKTRTSTAFRPQRPQRCASTNSAMTAHALTGRSAPLAKGSGWRNRLCTGRICIAIVAKRGRTGAAGWKKAFPPQIGCD